MPDYATILVSRDARGIATVTLDRPEVRNAMNPAMITELTAAYRALGADAEVRGIVVRGADKVFCSGGDLNWMRDVEGYTADEVAADSRLLLEMYRTIDDCPKPTIARIHGAAMAGGLGIAACCDTVIALAGTSFRLSEVRVGLTPGIISAFLLPRIGAGRLRHLAVTGALFDAVVAERCGLVHHVAADEAGLDAAVESFVVLALEASPEAVAGTKRLLREIAATSGDDVFETALEWNVRSRRSDTARDGIGAFLARLRPPWMGGELG